MRPRRSSAIGEFGVFRVGKTASPRNSRPTGSADQVGGRAFDFVDSDDYPERKALCVKPRKKTVLDRLARAGCRKKNPTAENQVSACAKAFGAAHDLTGRLPERGYSFTGRSR